MKYPSCPDCGEMRSKAWNGIICGSCGHDVSEYDPGVLPGYTEDTND